MTTLKSHSQNNESLIVLKYFKGRKGMLLDIGAFDGKSLSNSYDLIMEGWKGIMMEPDPRSFKCLFELYKDNKDVMLYPLGLAKEDKHYTLFVNGMLSTILESELKDAEAYTEYEGAAFLTWQKWYRGYIFNFITIDAEGADYEILEQIDLHETRTECLCIEHNGNEKMMKDIIDYCAGFGMKETYRTNENIILIL